MYWIIILTLKIKYMKHLLYYLLIAWLLITVTSCKKESTQSSINEPIIGNFSFDFNSTHQIGNTYTCELIWDNYLEIWCSSGEKPLPKYSLDIHIKMPTTGISSGNYYSYTSGTLNKIEYQPQISPASFAEFVANTTTTGKLKFNIINYNPGTKAISCTFNGTMENVSDHSVGTVSNGVVNGILKQ